MVARKKTDGSSISARRSQSGSPPDSATHRAVTSKGRY
jgi:hypothetical protein